MLLATELSSFQRLTQFTYLKEYGCQNVRTSAPHHLALHSLQGTDQRRHQAPSFTLVEAGKPASLGTGPGAQGKRQHPAARLAPPPSAPVHTGDRLGGQRRVSQTLPAYLEDRRQVLGHFQSLSLHRVDHILHPGAGAAMGHGGTVRIRARESKTAPDVPDWHRTPQPHRPGPGGGAEARPSCHLAATAEAQPAERDGGARAAPGLLQAVFRPQAPLTPLPGSPSSSHTLPTAPLPPRPHVTRISRDT